MLAAGDLVEVRIDSSAFEGTSVARVEGLVIFVPFGVPGDLVRVRIKRRRRKYLEGSIEEVLEPSADRVEPKCLHFGECGGCRLQNVAYDKQIAFKRDQVESLLRRIGGLEAVPVPATIAAPSPYHYRNKMEFSFGNRRWLTREEIASGLPADRDFALGLHAPGRFDRILEIQQCHLPSDVTSAVLNRVRQIARDAEWEPYDSVGNRGFLRNLVVRCGQATGDLMLVFITTYLDEDRMKRLVSAMLEEFDVTTIVNGINPGRSPIAAGEREVVFWGEGYIHDRIGSLTFRITPGAFFQPNTFQAERLVREVMDAARPDPHFLVFDLFSGLGTIGLAMAGRVNRVVGVEENQESVRLGGENAHLNGISNCEFIRADAVDALKPEFVGKRGKPDLIVLDPPRAGLHPDLVKRLLRLETKRLVYTSCNPATLARDLESLASSYRVEKVQPLDMFPQTAHIECVASLEWAD